MLQVTRKLITRGTVGLAVLALALAGCGGGDKGGAADDAPTDPKSVKGELTWWDTSDPKNEGPAFKKLVEKFKEKYPNVSINYQSVPFDKAQNKFKTAAEAGKDAPDILRAEVAWVPEFASLGYLYALDDTDLVRHQTDFLETPWSSNVYEGKTYGVPQVTDALGLMYNKALLEKAGVAEPPKTWDEVKTAAKAVKSKTGADGLYINAGGYFLLPFIYGEGGDLVDPDNKKIVVNSDKNIAGISIAQDLVKSGAAVKPSANDSYGTMMTLFKDQKVAMIINGPWEVNNVRNAPKFGGIENLGIAPVPAGSVRAGSPVGGHNYVVWSGMPQEKAKAAMAFIEFMTSADSQAFLAEELGLLPTRKSAYDLDSVSNNPVVSAFKPVLDSAVARPWIPEGGKFFTPLDKMATEVLVQGKDPKASLGKCADTYKAEVVPKYSL